MSVNDSFRLDGARALVTGASRGIGAAIACALAEAGADLALAARTKNALKVTADHVERVGGHAALLAGDLGETGTSARLVTEAAEQLGGLDILVHNAGVLPANDAGEALFKPLAETTDKEWEPVISVNLGASVGLCRAAYPYLAKSGRASVILISSICGTMASPSMDAYAVTKAAQLSLLRSLSVGWCGDGIRVNAVCPGWTATDMNVAVREDPELGPELLSHVPLGRWGRPEDIAAATVYLASPAAAFVTGHALVVDGGLSVAPVMGSIS
ncbi:NAD(P)-dependent dehydrogenase (short-subunit alcohol dehydrogenase family) [Streptomyces sp. V4I23]|uniref:SDR family NAD(P)-dependent oxidoreductase n=1 Tax=Streptomyces sp. V4I23 TaxID=3042282 RepID=UPI00278ADE88|nr:SDR family oxidoreductase [Streptomyces sp. V4I23]MDQ1005522.1 NAD(P)-dependent dehydrogenase (short-subunit alcohol dehydrogenase family) [Streptomyces sp. V4I23]